MASIGVDRMGMKMKLKRTYFGKTYTIGKLYLHNIYFCDTIEDVVRDLSKEEKVYGKTAIPFGTYKITICYSERFKRQLPLLKDVPFFTSIRIHSGNTDKDTEGCLLVGENKVSGMVINSRKTLDDLMFILSRFEDISIEIC